MKLYFHFNFFFNLKLFIILHCWYAFIIMHEWHGISNGSCVGSYDSKCRQCAASKTPKSSCLKHINGPVQFWNILVYNERNILRYINNQFCRYLWPYGLYDSLSLDGVAVHVILLLFFHCCLLRHLHLIFGIKSFFSY